MHVCSRYGISLLVFNSIDISLVGCAHSWAVEQDIRREIPYIYVHPSIILYFSFFSRGYRSVLDQSWEVS